VGAVVEPRADALVAVDGPVWTLVTLRRRLVDLGASVGVEVMTPDLTDSDQDASRRSR
jgi:hypothetical protein